MQNWLFLCHMMNYYSFMQPDLIDTSDKNAIIPDLKFVKDHGFAMLILIDFNQSSKWTWTPPTDSRAKFTSYKNYTRLTIRRTIEFYFNGQCYMNFKIQGHIDGAHVACQNNKKKTDKFACSKKPLSRKMVNGQLSREFHFVSLCHCVVLRVHIGAPKQAGPVHYRIAFLEYNSNFRFKPFQNHDNHFNFCTLIH